MQSKHIGITIATLIRVTAGEQSLLLFLVSAVFSYHLWYSA